MRRRLVILGAVAALLFAGLLAAYVSRRGDDDPTSAERATCYAVRDLEADLLDDDATLDATSPQVAAVLRSANRTDNETLIIRARQTQRRWRNYEKARGEAIERTFDSFLDVYLRLIDECNDLGVRIYPDK